MTKQILHSSLTSKNSSQNPDNLPSYTLIGVQPKASLKTMSTTFVLGSDKKMVNAPIHTLLGK